jgi:hypothetical protein
MFLIYAKMIFLRLLSEGNTINQTVQTVTSFKQGLTQ